MNRPAIVITPGEPAGVGPELLARLVHRSLPAESERPRLVAVGDPDLFVARARSIGLPIRAVVEPSGPLGVDEVEVVPVMLARPSRAGQLDPANAAYVLETLDVAIAGCQSGQFKAIVTGPVHKGVINESGRPFSGHTEYLAASLGARLPVMLLVSPTMRVALLTTHLPLSEVPGAVTPERLKVTLEILRGDLQAKFGIASPSIAVLGLNPHAGEGGHLGREEIDVMAPVLDEMRGRGWSVIGPLPADTAFTREKLPDFDAVLSMFHDQGLPVIKHGAFGRVVNVTLGLPVIRTSVDHGTALDIAGNGSADPGSLFSAVDLALQLARHATNRS
jgi:4-hydroxythreonine-4-phosphate dehydrogenase